MDRPRMDISAHQSGSAQSEDSALDLERNYSNSLDIAEPSPPLLQAFASCGQLSESNAAFLSWPCRIADAAEDRAHYFGNLQKRVLPEIQDSRPTGFQASTLLELMTIRAFHSKLLKRHSLGTAIGFRIKKGVLTDIPAIIVFVARKVHRQWLKPADCLPDALEAPGGVWCDLDVVEFAYYGAHLQRLQKNNYIQLWLMALVEVMTASVLVRSLGPGVYLGAVERATSFVTDNLWYGIFAGTNPETFVRADGAFIPFAEDFNMANVTTLVKGVGEIGDVNIIDLQSPVESVVGRQVVKVGRSSGFTTGTIMAYSLEYNDEKGICLFTDFLVVRENQQTFDMEGDSGSLILLTDQNGGKPRPIGIIWGGTANRGRLKLKAGQPPENWTTAVDLGRLLDVLELDLISSTETLRGALQECRNASLARTDSTVAESSPQEQVITKERSSEPPAISIFQVSTDKDSRMLHVQNDEFHIVSGPETGPTIEHQFIPSFSCKSPVNDDCEEESEGMKNLAVLLTEAEDETSVSLRLGGEPEPKRRKLSGSPAED